MIWRRLIKLLPAIWLSLSMAILLLLPASSILPPPIQTSQVNIPADCSLPVNKGWIQKVRHIQWVAYSSPTRSEDSPQLTASAIYEDLLTLKKAGFTGLITYGSSGLMGNQFLTIAEKLGYKGVIMGIWNPLSQNELNNAEEAASSPIVLGYSIGNEGLSERPARYSLTNLCSAISELRASTGKPVTTSEDIQTYYSHPELLSVGDWIFAISHPYWHWTKYALDAILWEQDQYVALAKQTDRFIFFKEVGLPTEGAFGLSESNQDVYYRGLAKTDVQFAYFEGFDQPSKTHTSVEPHWGIFNADLSPKLIAWNLMGYRLFTSDNPSNSRVLECSSADEKKCSVLANENTLLIGTERNQEYQTLIAFNTADLPDNTVISSIKLKIKSSGIKGLNPLHNGQKLMGDICSVTSQKVYAQPVANFMAGMKCNSNTGILSIIPNSSWYSVDFDFNALQSINPNGITYFRLRVVGMANKDIDRSYIAFHGSEPESADNPLLIVHYHLP
ncbi:MAG TPA: hypothetical protein VMT73_11820 [Anaerolineales bacterium]|nr:hypothetical protein [Anaerolineales bacterium]